MHGEGRRPADVGTGDWHHPGRIARSVSLRGMIRGRARLSPCAPSTRECFGNESRVEKQLATSGARAGQRLGCFIAGPRLAQHRPATYCASRRLCARRSIYRSAKQDSDIHVSMSRQEHYRADGVRIQHDPHAPGMAEKYGRPGETDAEGFDPYAGRVCALTANACRPCLLDCALTAARNTTCAPQTPWVRASMAAR